MANNELGLPPLAFAQLLASDTLEPEAVEKFRALMAREGVDEASLLLSDDQVPVRWFREVFPDLDTDQAIRLGYAFAERARLTSFGPLSVPLVSAGSVMEVVELLNFLPLIATSLNARFQPDDEGLMIWLTGNTGDFELDCLVATYCAAVVIRLIELLVGHASATDVWSSWQGPEALERRAGPQLAAVGIETPVLLLHVPPETLEEVCQFSDPIAYRLAITELRQSIEDRVDTKEFSRKVRILLNERHEIRSAQSVADELAVSLSTLKRRLQDEGTTFQGLREAALHERAILGLLDQSVPISQIALDLGYSDLANFSHAFKRWTGLSPNQFRRERQGSAGRSAARALRP